MATAQAQIFIIGFFVNKRRFHMNKQYDTHTHLQTQ